MSQCVSKTLKNVRLTVDKNCDECEERDGSRWWRREQHSQHTAWTVSESCACVCAHARASIKSCQRAKIECVSCWSGTGCLRGTDNMPITKRQALHTGQTGWKKSEWVGGGGQGYSHRSAGRAGVSVWLVTGGWQVSGSNRGYISPQHHSFISPIYMLIIPLQAH